jgi:hypothetical protein
LIQFLNISKFRRHLLNYIVKNHLPILIIEDDDFRQILTILNQNIEGYLIKKLAIINIVKEEFI